MNAEEIILMKMADIVFVDKRSFCFKTFYPLNITVKNTSLTMEPLETYFQS